MHKDNPKHGTASVNISKHSEGESCVARLELQVFGDSVDEAMTSLRALARWASLPTQDNGCGQALNTMMWPNLDSFEAYHQTDFAKLDDERSESNQDTDDDGVSSGK